LSKVDSIWLSDSPATDCKECGLRYFSECARCKKITCTWCSFVCEKNDAPREVYLCKDCQKSSERAA
jgi:hypothetical protein